jgi:hypothetical protein
MGLNNMEVTIEDIKPHMEEYFKTNGHYPKKIYCSLKIKRGKGFRAYCQRLKMKVVYV